MFYYTICSTCISGVYTNNGLGVQVELMVVY